MEPITERGTSPSPAAIRQEVAELPSHTLGTYARLWQLETWLRRMVRVELMALKGDSFDHDVRNHLKALEADKSLHHMTTAEETPLSYAPFGEIRRLIAENWAGFSSYLPPQSIWTAKLEEVMQIRHRIAHFRTSHRDDYQRVCQLLRDIDPGFWRFCTSYNKPTPILPAGSNPISAKYMDLDPFPWTETSSNHWARLGIADPQLRIAVTVEMIDRVWAAPSGNPEHAGRLYDVYFVARNQRHFDYRRLLEATRFLHGKAVFICLDQFASSVRVTIPSLLGTQHITEALDKFLEACGNTLAPGPPIGLSDPAMQSIVDEFSEVVLPPDNPLAFLSPGMECSFFNA